jgi:hypothetical protein
MLRNLRQYFSFYPHSLRACIASRFVVHLIIEEERKKESVALNLENVFFTL